MMMSRPFGGFFSRFFGNLVADGAGSLLVRSKLIGEEQLALAREAKTSRGGSVGEYLVLGGVNDERLTNFYHTRLMVPRLDPNLLARIQQRIIAKIPADMAAEFRVVPVALDRDQNLTVCMSDPSDTHAIDEIGFFTGCYVMRAVATQRQIAWCLAHYYGIITELGETLLEAREPEPQPTEPEPSPADGIPRPVRRPGPVTQKVEASRHKVVPPEAAESSQPIEITIGPAPTEREETGPTGPVPRRPTQEPNPPELGERVGEVEVRSETDATPASSRSDLPAVVLGFDEDNPIDTIIEEDEGDEVVILDRPRSPSSEPPPSVEMVESSGAASDDTDVVVLDQPKRRRRESRSTQLGLGIVPAARPRREAADSGALPGVAPAAETEPPATTEAETPAAATRAEPPAAVAEADVPAAVPQPIADETTDANATGRHRRIDYDESGWGDDDFGPPGTTIPPAYLGAMPDTESTGPHNAIPLNVPEDESGAVSVPVRAPSGEKVATLAATMEDVADSQRELEQSSIRLVETLRALDGASTRDAIVEALLDHAAMSFKRTAFLVVKGGKLVPFKHKGKGMAGGFKTASLALGTPSTIRDVVQARLPFRGRLPDPLSQDFIASVFGNVPPEILILPCAVRDRPVGVLCGTDRSGRIFHEHLSVVLRGAGDAFERILKQRKGS